MCPGFAADCLETLEEIAMQNRELFLGSGGREYNYIPALNDRTDHIQALADIVMHHSS
jgi:ferrochelatase